MTKNEDMVGKRYNEWTVLDYLGHGRCLCKCSCGVIKELESRAVRDGRTKSCGHSTTAFKDLSGATYGQLKVIEYEGHGIYKCECSCGKTVSVKKKNLVNGYTKSCGHIKSDGANNYNFRDLTGKIYGDWEVIKYNGRGKWICRCSCGAEQEVDSRALINGQSKSCGHEKNKFINLKGKQFGEITVDEYEGNGYWRCTCSCGRELSISSYYIRHGKISQCRLHNIQDIVGSTFGEWKVLSQYSNKCICKCSCGNTAEVNYYDLIHGKTRSCGHSTNKFIDITGKRFGKLIALKYKDGLWECKCDCGNMTNVSSYSLRSGNTKSCGCSKSTLARQTNIQKYGETAYSRKDTPREAWQIDALSTKDNLSKYLDSLGLKPTITDLTHLLDINYSTISQRIHKFGLDNKVEFYESRSAEEEELFRYIESIYSGKIIKNTYIEINPYELDIYIPDLKLAFEFDGNYWHSSKVKNRKYHQLKTIMCAKKGIRLIHIFEYEWQNEKIRAKLKSFIKDLLEIDQTIIYGRYTSILEIANETAMEFCDRYHLQGGIRGELSLGLYLGTQLLGVIVIGRPRFNRAFDYEIYRICFKPGIIVVGGVSKLFKGIFAYRNISSIVSYVDIAKFTGNSYLKIGMTTSINNITEPNYVWVNQYNKVLTRYDTTKSKLVKKGLGTELDTEKSIMESLGYNQVYDSGNLRFEWHRELEE